MVYSKASIEYGPWYIPAFPCLFFFPDFTTSVFPSSYPHTFYILVTCSFIIFGLLLGQFTYFFSWSFRPFLISICKEHYFCCISFSADLYVPNLVILLTACLAFIFYTYNILYIPRPLHDLRSYQHTDTHTHTLKMYT